MMGEILSDRDVKTARSIADNYRARGLQRDAARALLQGHLNAVVAKTPSHCNAYTFKFGRYKGKTAKQVATIDKSYLEWVLGTDLPKRYPELSSDIKSALLETG